MAGINAFAVKIYRPNYTRQLFMSANIFGKYDNLQLQVYSVYITHYFGTYNPGWLSWRQTAKAAQYTMASTNSFAVKI